jgi:hypothetical protein
MRRRLFALLLGISIASAAPSCSSDDDGGAVPATETSSAGPDAANASSASTPETLPIGKEDLELDEGGSYLSPDGFVPELRIDLTQAGWTSVHRDTDGFDLGQANPDVDAPLVAVAFLVPTEDTPQAALDVVGQHADEAGGKVREAGGPVGPFMANGLDVRGGEGELVASRDGGIALDATPEGRVQVWAAQVDGAPILVVVYVPDATLWGSTEAAVQQLLGSVRLA